MTDIPDNQIFDEAPIDEPTVVDAPVEDETSQSPFNEPKGDEPKGDEPKDAEPVVEAPKDDAPADKTDKEPTEDVEDEESVLDEETQKLVDDPKTSKWFKNYIKTTVEPQIKTANETTREIETLGGLDAIKERVNVYDLLNATTLNEHGHPTRSATAFLEEVVKREGPETLVQLMLDTGAMPSPADPSRTLFQELLLHNGIDPLRIEDLKSFAASGYKTTQNGSILPTSNIPEHELQLIPEELREAYASLTETERDWFTPYEGEDQDTIDARNERLTDKKVRLDANRETERKAIEKEEADKTSLQKQEQEFNLNWFNKSNETEVASGNRITEGFVDSLITHAQMDEIEARSIASLTSRALGGGQTADAINSRKALDKVGATIDPALEKLYGEWEENARNIAFHTLKEDRGALEKETKRQSDIEKSLALHGNKLVAALTKHFANRRADKVTSTNAMIDNATTPKNNFAATGTPAAVSTGAMPARSDFSDEAWERRNPFG